ncbi:MAG: hypothetical protein IJR45_01045 [Firmicutes bacterium]|nr:hypothetical protein [Bacillota bacterium]
MTKYENEIFDRMYQSYLMGGDLHTVNFDKKTDINKKMNEAVDALQEKGLIEITFRSEQRVRFRITDKGIDYGSAQC